MNSTRTVLWELPSALVGQLEQLARTEAISPEQLAAQLLSCSLEPRQPAGSGRCSLRTGLSSEGPLPLPLQQP